MLYAELNDIVAYSSDGAGAIRIISDADPTLLAGEVRVTRRLHCPGGVEIDNNLGIVLAVHGFAALPERWELVGHLTYVTLSSWDRWNERMVDKFEGDHHLVLTSVPSWSLPLPIVRSLDDSPYVDLSQEYTGNTQVLKQLSIDYLGANADPLWCDSRGYLTQFEGAASVPAGHMGGPIYPSPETVQVVSPPDIPRYIEIV